MRAEFCFAALGAALAAGCRRAPAPAPPAPAPSSATVTSPLAGAATSHTNELQARLLQEEGERLGIARLGKPARPGEPEPADMRPPIGAREGLARTRAMAAEFEAERRAMSRDKGSVELSGETPALILAPDRGAPVESSADAKGQ